MSRRQRPARLPSSDPSLLDPYDWGPEGPPPPDPARLALSIAGSLRVAGHPVAPEQVQAALKARQE